MANGKLNTEVCSVQRPVLVKRLTRSAIKVLYHNFIILLNKQSLSDHLCTGM